MRFVRRHPLLLSLILLAAIALGLVTASAVSVWRAAHNDEARRVNRTDVILVLGAAQYAGDPSPVFEERLDHAALLYEESFADRIVVLGAGQPGDAMTEAEAGVEYLKDLGIPPDALAASPEGSTSYESLEAAARYMDEEGLRTAFLVSDPWHNLRIRRMARDLGIEGYVSATFHSAARSQGTRFGGYVRETFAYIYYRLFGG